MNDASNRLAVIGGGIVGICAALFAQRAGHSVTLVEPYEPGSQTSFGNAGIICGGHYVPAAMPRAPMELLKLALNRTTYASYRVGALPGFARWLAAFWKQGAPERLNRTAEATLAAMGETVGLHRKLLGEAGASELLRDNGWIAVFREDADLEGIRAELDFAREAGVSFQQMGPGEACELEPGLKPVFRHAVLWNENASVSDPFAVSQAYLGLFRAAGGSVVNARCMALAPRNGGWRLETDTGALEFPQVVVAAGIWSTDLLKPLGYGFPLKPKRGYHRHFSARGNAVLSRPVVDDGIGYVLAPMRGGIRMTSGIELAGRDAPVSERMIARIEPYARELFPLDRELDAEPWMGRRPALPDSLPVVGRAPRHEGLWVDFGHAHLGLTLGPLTGLLLAQMMTGEKTIVDPRVFDPARYA